MWPGTINKLSNRCDFRPTMKRDLLCIKMCMFVCFQSAVDTLATPRLLPSASFRRHHFNRLIITVNHRHRPVVFPFPRRQPSLCPCPMPPTPLSQISYSQARRVERRRETGERKEDSEKLTAGLAGDGCPGPVWRSGDFLLIVCGTDSSSS